MTYGWYRLVIGIREQKYVLPVTASPSDSSPPTYLPPYREKANLESKKNSEYAREKMWSRIHLIPVLQAEEDRDLVRRHLADQAREKELMGENFKVYHGDRSVLFSLHPFCPLPFRWLPSTP